jgi:hypothetical protein
MQAKASGDFLLVTHASTSSINPVVWREVMSYLLAYWYRSPYQSRVFNPSFRFYANTNLYKVSKTSLLRPYRQLTPFSVNCPCLPRTM